MGLSLSAHNRGLPKAWAQGLSLWLPSLKLWDPESQRPHSSVPCWTVSEALFSDSSPFPFGVEKNEVTAWTFDWRSRYGLN